jgi:multidrug efflux pump subunit AcrA (membrane-fusion protein)
MTSKLRIMRTAAIIALATAGCLAWPAGPVIAAEKDTAAEVQVKVIRATPAYFTKEIRVAGLLVAREEAVVSLDIPAYKVSEVLVGEGDKVTSGQTILVRLARLPAEGLDPNMDRRPPILPLKAPATGTIVRSTAVVGATASPVQSEPLFRIAMDNELELEAEVPSVHVPELKPKQTARVEVENNRELSGRVRLVPAAIDVKTQLGHARISLLEQDPRLRLGMLARATITVASPSQGLSVPHAAVRYSSDGPRVQVVRGNVVQTLPVQVGYQSDTDTEIRIDANSRRNGLREGDLVVANAGTSLRDGDKVKPIEADTAGTGLP